MDASEIHPRRLNAKDVLIPHTNGEFVFPLADGSAKLSGRDYEFQEPTLRRESTVRRENLSGECHGDREESQPEEAKDDIEARRDFWSIQVDFVYRHHIEPRVQHYVQKEETFTVPLIFFNVTRSTFTNLDVVQKKRIDDYWNVHENRSLSDSWTRFTKFTLLKETPPKGYMWADKNSNNYTTRSYLARSLDKNWKS